MAVFETSTDSFACLARASARSGAPWLIACTVEWMTDDPDVDIPAGDRDDGGLGTDERGVLRANPGVPAKRLERELVADRGLVECPEKADPERGRLLRRAARTGGCAADGEREHAEKRAEPQAHTSPHERTIATSRRLSTAANA